jgi:signal peptidase I
VLDLLLRLTRLESTVITVNAADMDFSQILVILLAVSGLILVADAAILKRRRRASSKMRASLPVQYARSLFPVILIVLGLRSFIVEPFPIPSASMMPGLVDGDFIFVNKFSYGLRLPVLNSKFLSLGQPQRGDVVVFRLPSDPSVHYIKRLIGLPGDHIVVRDNTIFINGAQVPVKRDGEYTGAYGFSGADLEVERIGERDHLIMLAKNRMATDYDSVVPPGNYFFMGDKRNDSGDSRFGNVGFVPDRNLVGRAMLIWMNWQIPGWPIWHRFGTKIS